MRNAQEVRQDTGASVAALARFAVAAHTYRSGGVDAASAARIYDVDLATMRRALESLVRAGWAVRGQDMGETIYSMGPRMRTVPTSVYGIQER